MPAFKPLPWMWSTIVCIPPGHCAESGAMAPEESRAPFHHPSSMSTYSYPASFMPDDTRASACCLITVASMAPAKLFQEFQPIGGLVIGAAPEAADAGGGSKVAISPTSSAHTSAD